MLRLVVPVVAFLSFLCAQAYIVSKPKSQCATEQLQQCFQPVLDALRLDALPLRPQEFFVQAKHLSANEEGAFLDICTAVLNVPVCLANQSEVCLTAPSIMTLFNTTKVMSIHLMKAAATYAHNLPKLHAECAKYEDGLLAANCLREAWTTSAASDCFEKSIEICSTSMAECVTTVFAGHCKSDMLGAVGCGVVADNMAEQISICQLPCSNQTAEVRKMVAEIVGRPTNQVKVL